MQNVGSNDEHADCTTSGTDHQKLPATKVIDQKQDPDEGHDGLDHSEDASGEERSTGAANANGCEHFRRVVVDSVDSGAVLPHKHDGTEEKTPLDLTIPRGCPEGLPEALTDGSGLLFENEFERGNFFDHVEVVGGQLANPAKVLKGCFAAVLGQEPARALFDPESSNEKETCGDELYSEGNQPLRVIGRKRLLNAVVDPLGKLLVSSSMVEIEKLTYEADETSDLPAKLIDTNKATSDSWWSYLRDIYGNNHTASSDPDASKNAASKNQA